MTAIAPLFAPAERVYTTRDEEVEILEVFRQDDDAYIYRVKSRDGETFRKEHALRAMDDPFTCDHRERFMVIPFVQALEERLIDKDGWFLCDCAFRGVEGANTSAQETEVLSLADRDLDESALAPVVSGPDGTTQLALVEEPPCFENEVDDTEVDEEDAYALSELEVATTENPTVGDHGAAGGVRNEALPAASPQRDPACTLCPLHGRALTVCVGGEGPSDAPIMLIGQNPGAEEDREGLPFVGPPGEDLNRYLEAAGLRRADVYISNAVKCISPANRVPSKKEMAACMTYLVNEIAEIRPEVIIPLGNTALQMLCGAQKKITKERGQQQTFSDDFAKALAATGILLPEYTPYIVPTIHPSAVRQSPKGKQFEVDIIEDLKLARAQATGVFAEIPVPWGYNDGLTPEVVRPRMLAINDLAGQTWDYDIETNAKEIWDPAFRIRMLSIDSDGTGQVAVFRGESVAAGIEALKIAHDANAALSGHNASAFDRPGIEVRTGINLRNTDDTMLMAHLVDEEAPKNLQDLCVRRIKVRPWKDEVTWSWADGPQTADEWDRAGLYSARDSRYARLLRENLQAELRTDPALESYYKKLFLPLSRALSKVERTGVYLSLDQIGRAAGEFTIQRVKAEARVRAIVGNDKFNPGSPKQVREILFDRMKLPVQEWTDSDDPQASTNELSLKKLRYLCENTPGLPAEVPAFVEAELEYREAVKMLGTYIEPYIERVDQSPDGRVHFWYSLIRSVSRSSGDGQQIPRDPRIRSMVSAPPGRALVQGDFSQMELRIAAHLSQDPNMLAIYRNPGGDIHRFTASNITGKEPQDITKAERDDAKPWNFATLYGSDEYTIESIMLKDFDLIYPRHEVTRRRDAFHNQFIGLQKTWYPSVWAESRASGQIRDLCGRVRRLPEIYSTDDRKRLEAFRQAINFTDQSLGFNIAGIALCCAVGMGMQVSWFLHDGIYAECDVSEVETVKQQFAEIEAQVPQLLQSMFGVELSVPLPIDVTVKLG